MARLGLWSMSIGTFLACGAVQPAREPPEPAARQLYVRGVVADAELGRVFALDQERRLQILDLETGTVLWRGDDTGAPAPLARLGRRLVGFEAGAEKHRFRLVALDLDRLPETVARSEAVELPGWVSVVERRGRSFGLRPRVHGSRLEIEWTARSWYAGGARPTPEVRGAARREARGRVVFDADGAGVSASPAAEPETDGRSHRYWDGYGFTEAPLSAGGSAAVLVRSPVDGGETLGLRRLDGDEAGEVTLASGLGVKAQLSAAGDHLMASSLDPEGTESIALYALSPIAKIASLPPPWPLHAGVLGKHLFRVVEQGRPAARRLEVVRLADGRELWSVPLPAPALGPVPR